MGIFDNIKNIFKQAQETKKTVPNGFQLIDSSKYFTGDAKKTNQLNELKSWTGACVSVISDEIAAVQIKLFEQKADGGVEEITDSPVLNLLNRVNEFTTKFDHFWLTQSYLELTGESPWYVEKNTAGEPINIYFLKPDKFTPVAGTDSLVKEYIYRPDIKTEFHLPFEDVIFLKILNPANPFRGKGTLEQAQLSVNIDEYSEKWNENFFKNSARPEVVLTIKDLNQMNEEQRDKLKQSLRKAYGGTDKSHQTMVLWGDMDIKPLTTTAKDMDFTEQSKMTRDKILGIFRVPKAIIAQTDGVNLANAETAQFVFARYTILPKMERLIQQLNEFYLPMFPNTENQYLDFVSPVQENRDFELKKVESGLKNGYLTINEVRQLQGLNDVDGGDVIYLPLNIAPIGGEKVVKELKVIGKKGAKGNQERLNQMKALNRDYYNSKELSDSTNKEIKKIIKSEIKRSIKNKELKIWDNDKCVRFWEAKNKVFNKFLPVVQKTFKEIFSEQKKEVLKNLKKEVKEIKTFDRILKQNNINNVIIDDKWNKTILKITLPIFTEIFAEGGEQTNDFLGIDESFDMDSEKIKKLLETNTRLVASSVNKTTNDKIVKELTTGFESGEGIKDLTVRINRVFSEATKSRAENIAMTETARFNEKATEQAYIDSGIVEAKKWQVDGNPCPRCLSMQGKIVSLKENFIDKGGADPLGNVIDYSPVSAPPLHPSCLCTLVPVFVKERKHIDKIKKMISYKKSSKKSLDVLYKKKISELDNKIKELDVKIKETNSIKDKEKKGLKEIDEKRKELKDIRNKMVEEYNKEADEQ